jgi:hypothetical protein
MFRVVLKNVNDQSQKIEIGQAPDARSARTMIANFRKAKWIERRPNLETIDHIGLTFEKMEE